MITCGNALDTTVSVQIRQRGSARSSLRVVAIRWVTFDCYGTLIDWQKRMAQELLPLLPSGTDRQTLIDRYNELESEFEQGEHRPYREVLDLAWRQLLTEAGCPLRDHRPPPLPTSFASSPPFPDVPKALRELHRRGYRFAILSNVDNDLLAASIAALGIFPDLTVTAEDVRSYKPAPAHWQRFEALSGARPEETVHVAASLSHDIAPASRMGYRTVWVVRSGWVSDRITPTRILSDLRDLPDTIDALARTTGGKLTAEMQALVRAQKLAYVATVGPDGEPNLSPKGTTTVWDDDHLVFADLRSPHTIRNLRRDPRVELNVVDIFRRRGYRFRGTAEIFDRGERFEAFVRFFSPQVERAQERIRHVVLISVEQALPLTSPAYDVGATEEELETRWRTYYGQQQHARMTSSRPVPLTFIHASRQEAAERN
jgi:uncharacterized protein